MKRILSGLLMLAAGILFSVSSNQAYAALCELTSPLAMLNITDDITLKPAEKGAAGTVLWSKTFSVPDISYKCNSATQSTWHSSYTRNYITSQIDNVYVTEIPGIGIRMKWPTQAADAWLPGNSGAAVTCAAGCSIKNSTVLVEFVQTGTLNAGESYIPVGSVAEASVIPTADSSDKLSILSINFGTAIKVKPYSCTLNPSTNYIDLGTYSLADFVKDNSKQGDKKEFTITVACPEPANVKLQFDTVINSQFASLTGVLGVETGEGYAENFAIRLYEKSRYSSTALTLGQAKEYPVTSMLTNTYQAQIYVPANIQRDSQLTAGKVVGVVVYTMIN
ncbi:fimbrial protein [Citrobacter sedlakii]|uniref:fimbrial protein n=1 Tax=Citrobacter TaxID=544 RepID=UPI001969D0CB|nr:MULTISPECIES: fimbrial protein [Citrobacter]MBM9568927.1 fimbrial protein [Citrobacter sedlakii]HBL4690203.1 fimbrial protein [Citrobacter sedlakii]HBL4704642.1 fimbrial protein [Citrobacter sedlakii]HBL4719391.1 fimbrial protein [Citrobacter sedlakii]HCA7840342.1 fimbrial protein [Citrobacter sedlakii]